MSEASDFTKNHEKIEAPTSIIQGDHEHAVPIDAQGRQSRRAVRFLGFVVCVLLGACMATPTTFVLDQPHRFERFEAYAIQFAPIADDAEFDAGLRQSFEVGLNSGLEAAQHLRALQGTEITEHTLQLRYRAAGLAGGHIAMRAGTAAINAFLPVGVVPELGGGDLGVETTFIDRGGTVVGRILVQSEVHGLLSTDANTMRRIGARTGDYVAKRFTAAAAAIDTEAAARRENVVNLSPEKAKAELLPLEKFIGVWDMQYEIQIADQPAVHARVMEVDRWEAGGRVFLQFAETQDAPEQLFRGNAILWDPVARALKLVALDSTFGMHESDEISFEYVDNTLRAVCSEQARVTEIVEVFAADGMSRTGTKTVWSPDHDRLLVRIRSEGRKRERGLAGGSGP